MAKHTNIQLRQDVIYCVYVRNHTLEGTFRAVMDDLDRIKALGTDIIWFMPIHPIGVKGKKGSLGCPYANRDYRAVNPEYGTMEDFKALVDAIHARGMKCIIDVVYNHTSPDSTLVTEHPEFFYHKEDGSMGNHVGEWTDVVDLDYTCKELWDYQIQSLVMWARIVDGFRCDVASLVPVEFWEKARQAVEQVNPGCIWLAETVFGGMGQFCRKSGMYYADDYEMYRAFDLEYDYDIWEVFDKYLKGEATLSHYLDMINFQERTYPFNYIKMHCLENHDQPRIRAAVREEKALVNFTAMLYFLKGTTLIYAGQEFGCDQVPSLFDKDVFPRDTGLDLSALLSRFYGAKKAFLAAGDYLVASADDGQDVAILERDDGSARKLGLFSLKGKPARVKVDFPDGTYTNRLDGAIVTIQDGMVDLEGDPIWITQ